MPLHSVDGVMGRRLPCACPLQFVFGLIAAGWAGGATPHVTVTEVLVHGVISPLLHGLQVSWKMRIAWDSANSLWASLLLVEQARCGSTNAPGVSVSGRFKFLGGRGANLKCT